MIKLYKYVTAYLSEMFSDEYETLTVEFLLFLTVATLSISFIVYVMALTLHGVGVSLYQYLTL